MKFGGCITSLYMGCIWVITHLPAEISSRESSCTFVGSAVFGLPCLYINGDYTWVRKKTTKLSPFRFEAEKSIDIVRSVLGSSSDDKRNRYFNSQCDQQSQTTFWEGTMKGSSLEISRMDEGWWGDGVMGWWWETWMIWDYQHPWMLCYMICGGYKRDRFNWKFQCSTYNKQLRAQSMTCTKPFTVSVHCSIER